MTPRYSKEPFPPYRFVPGQSPHPRRDPKGHAYGTAEPKPPPVDPSDWKGCGIYLLGIDLYNHGYWWECHEALEALWHAVGHTTPTGQFLQGVIQVSAANLKRYMGLADVARGMANQGLARHKDLPELYMGVRLKEFERDVLDYFGDKRKLPALITLIT